MVSFREYHSLLSALLAPLPTDTRERALYLDGYTQALEDLRQTWVTSSGWVHEHPLSSLPHHLERLTLQLEQRLGLAPAAVCPGGVATGMIPPATAHGAWALEEEPGARAQGGP